MSLLDYLNPRSYIDPYNTYSFPFKRTQTQSQPVTQAVNQAVVQASPVSQVASEANKGFNMGNLTDYIPNIFGRTAPTTYEGLLGLGLLTPEQVAQTQRTANIQGLLGAGLALAQGMSKVGPPRTAAENILGALAGGFGAAGGAYQQGLQNFAQQQQLQSAALTQQQALNKVKSIQEAKRLYPDLAPLADIDSGEFVKQVIARDRAKIYGFGSPQNQAVQSVPQPIELPSAPVITAKGQEFVGVPNFSVGEKYQDESLNQQVQQIKNQQQVQQQQIVDPVNVAKANDARRNAALAISLGHDAAATFFQNEADRLDPKEQIFFRDGMMVSSKRGVLGKFDGFNKKQLIDSLPDQFVNVYPTLKPRVDALIKRAPGMTGDQINSAVQGILDDDSKILAELDPKLRALELEKRRSSKTDVNVYTGQLSKTTAGQVEQGALSDAAAIARLNNIQFSYKPEYQNIQYRGKQAWNTLRDKFGGLPESEKNQLAQYSQYRQNALQNLNQTIKDITGAAMGVQEADRIIASLPNAGTDIWGGDSPTEFEAKLNNAIRQTKYALARKNYALKKGISWENTPLDNMPRIIQERGKQIEKEYKLDPKDPSTKNTVLRQLAAEFGVVF